MNNSLVLLHLSLIDSIGPSSVARIMSSMSDQNLGQLYDMNLADCMQVFGFAEITAKKLVDGLADTCLLEQEILLLERNPVSWTTIVDPAYPELLKNIHLPPIVLYWQGSLPGNMNSIAIVGSREANAYGQAMIERLVPDLVHNGWAIISGGARGADAMAHHATLDAGGITVAVLGSGLLRPYPPENQSLFDAIVQKGGALVSPFPLIMESLPGNFPARNRIIAGLSRGCVVVQAAAKSGARITADFCLSQGRDVFAIPGSIDDLLSAGCHALIQQGAKLITKVDDILIEYGQEAQSETVCGEQAEGSGRAEKQMSIAVTEPGPEGAIINACQKPCSVDELLEVSGLALIEMTKMLFDLQLKGRITQNMAGLWEKR